MNIQEKKKTLGAQAETLVAAKCGEWQLLPLGSEAGAAVVAEGVRHVPVDVRVFAWGGGRLRADSVFRYRHSQKSR